jgi:hypothetical protein
LAGIARLDYDLARTPHSTIAQGGLGMTQSERKRQQKQIKKKRRSNEIKKLRNIKQNISGREILLASQRSPWLGCYVSGASGMFQVCAIRRTRDALVASYFLLDSYCLGIKDAFFIKDFDIEAFRERENTKPISPEVAFKWLQSAIAYAKGIGFEPHPSTSLCFLIFGDTDVSKCDEEFTFGCNGKPTFIAGPYDSVEMQFEVLQKLRSLGEGNYSFTTSVEKRNADFVDKVEFDSEDDDSDSDEESDYNKIDAESFSMDNRNTIDQVEQAEQVLGTNSEDTLDLRRSN